LKDKPREACNAQESRTAGITAGYEILARIAKFNTNIDVTAVTITGPTGTTN
jgi:hypothetical protein